MSQDMSQVVSHDMSQVVSRDMPQHVLHHPHVMDVVRQLLIDACVVAHERMPVSVFRGMVVGEKFGDMKPLRRSVCTPRPWRVVRAQRPDFGSFSRWLAFEAGVAKAFRNVMVSESITGVRNHRVVGHQACAPNGCLLGFIIHKIGHGVSIL